MGWLSNRFLLLGVAAQVAIILSLVYVPLLAILFEHHPLPPFYWPVLLLYAPALYVVEWIRKRAAQRIARRPSRQNRGVVLT